MYAEDTKTSPKTKPHSYGFAMYSPVSSISSRVSSRVSSSPGKPLTMDDLSSPLQHSGESKGLAELRQKLLNMRMENSQLVVQNHRLLSELEDSSHQLLMANSKIDALHHKVGKHHQTTVGQGTGWEQQVISAAVERDAAASHIMELEKELADLKTKLSKKEASSTAKEVTNLLDKERREWKIKQTEMVRQVADLQEECSRLREAHSLAEERVIQSRTGSYESLSSLSSSQPMHYMHSSGFHSLPSRSPTLQQQVSRPSSDLYLSMPASNIHPGATTAAAVAAKPTIRHSGSVPTLQYSIAEYLPSKGQFKTSTHLHDFQKQLNESALKSSRDALATDLEKSKYQIKEFEGRVSLLDSQLKEKSSMMEEYVSELSQLRSEMVRIKKNQEREISELKEEYSRQIEEMRIAHTMQCQQLESQVMQSRRSCDTKETLASQLQSELQAVHSESQSHARNVTSLQSELERERLSHQESMLSLSTDVRLGEARVGQLEKALETYHSELQGYVNKIEADAAHHEDIIKAYKHQMELLRSELAKTQSRLEDKNQEVEATQTELKNFESQYDACLLSQRKSEEEMKLYKTEFEKLSSGVQQLQTNNSKEAAELKQQLAHSEALRNSLVQQVYSLQQKSQEMTICREELAALRQSHSHEVVKLQKQLASAKLELSTSQNDWTSREEELKLQAQESEQKCSNMENTLIQLQEDLSKRSQQVNELDVALHSHQADTTSRRLQLERALTQRQADLRARTQEVDDLKQALSTAKETVDLITAEKDRLQLSYTKQLEKKSLEVKELTETIQRHEEKMRSMEAVLVSMKKELQEAKEELTHTQESHHLKERHFQASKELAEKELTKVKKQLDSVQEQHVNQIQRLQESHTRILASRDQQSSAHRLQTKQLQENESRRMEELSRCRAQVTNLSAELAAERMMSEEARQQVTLLGAETARLQAQVASLQRAVTINISGKQMEHHLGNSQLSRTPEQGRNKSSDESSQEKLARSHSTNVGHFSSHISQTPSVSSSDTESILMSEVEYKVLPPHSSHSNSQKMTNELDNSKRKKGDIFEV